MPSVSDKQKKLMNIAAHTPGGYGGVSQNVGKEFHKADKVNPNMRMSNKPPMKPSRKK